MDSEEHLAAVETWRAARDARLRTREGWLGAGTVVVDFNLAYNPPCVFPHT